MVEMVLVKEVAEVEGISLVDFIESNQVILENGGGHDVAAGITLKEEALKLLNKNLQTFVSSQINNSLLAPKIELDCSCELNELNIELLDHYRKLEPFGFDNPEPVLVCSNLNRLLNQNPKESIYDAPKRKIYL